MGIVQYLKETQSEMRHVSWPSRNVALAFTGLVVLVSAFVAIYLGFFDYIFTLILNKLIM